MAARNDTAPPAGGAAGAGLAPAGRRAGDRPARSRGTTLYMAAAVLGAATFALAAPARAQPEWHQAVEKILGHGKAKDHQVFEVELPRTDLTIEHSGLRLDTHLDFTDQLRFMPASGGVMFMGELILTTKELNPVISRLEARGFQVAAAHRHILDLSQQLVWVHFNAMGEPAQLASSVRYALAASATPLPAKSDSAPAKAPDLDMAAVEKTLGQKGKSSNGMLTFSIPVTQKVTMDGVALPPDMGMSIGLTFQPLGDGAAAATGEFPLTAEEVNPVVQALQAHGLQVEAIHNHMLTEQPRVFFVHFWAQGQGVEIARGLRAAVEAASPSSGK